MCESTISLKPGSLLAYRSLELSCEQAKLLLTHLKSNLDMLESVDGELKALCQEGVMSAQEAQQELASFHEQLLSTETS